MMGNLSFGLALLCVAMMALMCLPMAFGMIRSRWRRHTPTRGTTVTTGTVTTALTRLESGRRPRRPGSQASQPTNSAAASGTRPDRRSVAIDNRLGRSHLTLLCVVESWRR